MVAAERTFGARSIFDIFFSLAMLVAAGVLVFNSFVRNRPPERAALKPPAEPFSIANAPTKGAQDSRLVLIMFSDFECPFCKRFTAETLPELERRYVSTGQVTLAFEQLPLKIHPHAFGAAVSAECAHQQGKFWPIHDLLFASAKLEDDQAQLASEAGLDMTAFQECVSAPTAKSRVSDAAQRADSLGIHGTPAFFIGTRSPGDSRVHVEDAISGAVPTEEFAKRLDKLISRQS